jgi:hypothetical protein
VQFNKTKIRREARRKDGFRPKSGIHKMVAFVQMNPSSEIKIAS